ncbi:MAG: GTP 3',8-cyclase MoaA [Gammaproteobacteria bacterium]|nr:GTP 3',8-cyclase MoaA [Gammaproteobacteria bacterium]
MTEHEKNAAGPSVARFGAESGVVDTRGRSLRDLRISVIDRCNFRCPYCMPADLYGEDHEFLPRSDWLTAGEIRRVAGLFQRLGVNKLRITGGEPLLRKDLGDIVAGLAALEGINDIAMTTNGSRLAERAAELKDAGLKRVTVSIDSIDRDMFRQMSGGRGDLDATLAGIATAREIGFESVKVNATVLKGQNEGSVLDLVDYFRGTGVIVRFIEYMDVGTLNGWKPDQVVSSKTLHDQIHARWPLVELEQNYRGEVARRYAFEDGQGEIGFISSVTEPFCGDCHRARISADGTIYTCLFANLGTNLRIPLRAGASDADIVALLQNVWRNRSDRYSELRDEIYKAQQRKDRERKERERVEMYRMGG